MDNESETHQTKTEIYFIHEGEQCNIPATFIYVFPIVY